MPEFMAAQVPEHVINPQYIAEVYYRCGFCNIVIPVLKWNQHFPCPK